MTTGQQLYFVGRDPETGETVRVPISQADAEDFHGADLLSQATKGPTAPTAEDWDAIERGDW